MLFCNIYLCLQGTEHLQALARLSKANLSVLSSKDTLFCSKCGEFFNTDTMMDHADHIIQVTQDEADVEEEGQSPVRKKRKLMMSIVNEHDGDLGDFSQEDAVNMETGSMTDSVEDPSFEPQSDNVDEVDDEDEYVVDDDEVATSEEEKEAPRSENSSSSNVLNDNEEDDANGIENVAENLRISETPDPESESDAQYYYFCLDCEELASSSFIPQSDLFPNFPKFPVTMDIAKHMTAKNHQNFVPIRKKFSINVQNLSFNPNYHKTVIKRWKNLVKAGEITEVAYTQPRVCRKCNIAVDDAVDMFKHIRDVHIKNLETN